MSKRNLIAIVLFLAGVVVSGILLLNSQEETPKTTSYQTSKLLVKNKLFDVEIADTVLERTQGLMNRESLGENQGMLFIFEKMGVYPFWMASTLIPLDIIWLDENYKIVFIQHNAVPCQENNQLKCQSYNPNIPAKFVLEVNAGISKELGLQTGDIIEEVLVDENNQ